MWPKGNRTVEVWWSLRGDWKFPPLDFADAIGTILRGLIVKGEGIQQVAALSNVDVRNFAQKDLFGFRGESAQVLLDHSVEVAFFLLTHLNQYLVDGNKVFR